MTHPVLSQVPPSPSIHLYCLHRHNPFHWTGQTLRRDTMAPTSSPQLGAALKLVLKPRRMEIFTPFLVGGWLDTFFLGLTAVAFAQWVLEVRQTERRWVKWLVGYLMLISLGSTALTMIHWFFVFINGFGDYTTLMDTNGTCLLKAQEAGLFAFRTEQGFD